MRSIKDSLSLFESSLSTIRTALSNKLSSSGGVPSKLKLSEVAGQIRKIEKRTYATLRVTWTHHNNSRNGNLRVYQYPSMITIYNEDIPIGTEYVDVNVTEMGTYGVAVTAGLWGETRVTVSEFKIYEVLVQNEASPGWPEEPWFEGMNVSDPEQPLIEKTEETI